MGFFVLGWRKSYKQTRPSLLIGQLILSIVVVDDDVVVVVVMTIKYPEGNNVTRSSIPRGIATGPKN